MRSFFLVLVLAFFFSSCQEDKIVFVADHFGKCEEQCLLIRESKNDDWTNFTETIEGFKYEEGFSYKLKISITKKKNENLTYSLVEIISKIKTEEASFASIDNGKKWNILQIEGFEIKTDRAPDFTIEHGIIKGNSGCNTFGGNILLNDEGLFEVGMLRMTKMYCQDYMELEKIFTGTLSKASNFTIKDNNLSVFDKDKNLLFTANQKVKTKTIEDTWYISSIKGFSNKTDKIPQFTIKEGQINGNNGCNTFGGIIKTDKSGLFNIGMLRVTKMYCEKYADLEKAFHNSLSKVAFYKITDDTLFLLDKSKYVLISATTNKTVLVETTTSNESYIIEYNTYSRELAIRNKVIENKNILYYHDVLPIKTDEKKKTISKTELKFFKDELEKIGIKNLEKLEPPSTKYQNDEVPGATLIVSYENTSYRVPTFDHGNPPAEIKAIVEKIMKLRLE